MSSEFQPRIDLHRHLEGDIRPETVLDLARKFNKPLPGTLEEILPLVRVTEPVPGLMPFIERLNNAITVLGDLDACKRIARECVENASKDNIAYLEIRFSPLYMARPNNLPPEGVVEAVIDGAEEGQKMYHVRTNLIGILSRTYGVKECSRELDALLAYHDHIVALDLAGDEINFPPELFVKLFQKAADYGLAASVHAGEVKGPVSILNIWRAIHLLDAVRIGHALHAVEDPALLDFMAKYRIGVESAITSNVQTKSISDITEHPVKTFLQHGILDTINTDDPSTSGIILSYELEVAAPAAGLTPEEIAQAQRNALEIAFLSAGEKEELKITYSLQNDQSGN
jgi:adenosine deaminase